MTGSMTTPGGQVHRWTAALIVVHLVALFAGFTVLAAVFQFPEVLRLPAVERLALFRREQAVVQPTYWLLALTGLSQVAIAVLVDWSLPECAFHPRPLASRTGRRSEPRRRRMAVRDAAAARAGTRPGARPIALYEQGSAMAPRLRRCGSPLKPSRPRGHGLGRVGPSEGASAARISAQGARSSAPRTQSSKPPSSDPSSS